MGFTINEMTEMLDKAYEEAKRHYSNGNLTLAKKKFFEASVYCKKLAALEPDKKDKYLARHQKLMDIYNGINIPQAPPPQPRRSSAPQSSRASSTVGSMMMGDEEMSQYYTFFNTSDLKFGFEGVIGLDEAKEAVTEYVINPIKYPEAYNYDFMDSKCILLEGPPGTGKTTFAKAVAKEISQPFVLVNVAQLVNCYVGETGKIIDKVFDSFRKFVEDNNTGLTVFFDEFDEIAKSRTGDDKASMTAVPALLRNLDGMNENKDILVLANTNCKESLDAGILSRFRRKIYIPLPDRKMRKKFFSDKLRQLEPEYFDKLDMAKLADESDGLSGRTITQVCDDFFHFMGGVKAGLRKCDDLNSAILQIIRKAKGE